MKFRLERSSEVVRYVLNGLFATALHFSVFSIAIQVFHVPIAALASLIATTFGITASFLGNRYFVFASQKPLLPQAFSFAGIYLSIACLHVATIAILTDWLKFDFRLGFIVATVIQTVFGYLGNRRLIFNDGRS
jgi:putative flippase GtrA